MSVLASAPSLILALFISIAGFFVALTRLWGTFDQLADGESGAALSNGSREAQIAQVIDLRRHQMRQIDVALGPRPQFRHVTVL